MAEALPDNVLLDLQVLIDEIGAITAVGHDAAYVSGSQHDAVGPLVVEEAAHGDGVEQVELAVRAPHEAGVTLRKQVAPNGRTDQSAMAGDIYFKVFVHHAGQYGLEFITDCADKVSAQNACRWPP